METIDGVPVTDLSEGVPVDWQGTRIHYLPDKEIFEDVHHSLETLKSRFMELAFLNAGVRIFVTDERSSESREYHFEGGVSAFVQYLNRDRTTLFAPPVVISGERNDIKVDMALQYNDEYQERILTYANLIHTVEGGTHLMGLRQALTRALNEAARSGKLLNDKEDNLTGDATRLAGDAEPFWHPTDPNRLYFLPTNGLGMQIFQLDLGDDREGGRQHEVSTFGSLDILPRCRILQHRAQRYVYRRESDAEG